MELTELEPGVETTGTRARRALALMVVSLVAITATGLVFLHPVSLSFGATTAARAPALHQAYRVAAVDFVDERTGWVVVVLQSGEYKIMHTADGGQRWMQELSGSGEDRATYIKFFDRSAGVFAPPGAPPVLYRTSDGGKTWSMRRALRAPSTVLSWSFVDSDHGWMLVNEAPGSPAVLFRTDDGGSTWSGLGPPVAPPDQAFNIHFTDLTTGWLASAGAGPYAYKTDDFGATWSRVAFPAPAAGWPGSARFFVDVQRTSGRGAVASVVAFAPFEGRIGAGGTIRQFPPLEVPFYDGSKPNNYIFPTLIDQVIGGPYAAVQAPQALLLSTVDNGSHWTAIDPPSASGAIGYFDAANWWWIGGGLWAGSKDGGVTWTDVRGVGLIEPLPGSLKVLDRDHAWFAGWAGSRPVLEATDDGGVSWRMVMLPPIEDLAKP